MLTTHTTQSAANLLRGAATVALLASKPGKAPHKLTQEGDEADGCVGFWGWAGQTIAGTCDWPLQPHKQRPAAAHGGASPPSPGSAAPLAPPTF